MNSSLSMILIFDKCTKDFEFFNDLIFQTSTAKPLVFNFIQSRFISNDRSLELPVIFPFERFEE
jgi:hypothetical protein